MHGKLTTICPACGQAIMWKKITWNRPEDGALDWDLEVRCGCYIITNEKIRKAAHDDFYAIRSVQAREHQNRRIDAMMRPGANAALEAMCRELNRT